MTTARKTNSGITLVELLAAVAIVAILMAILVPTFKSVQGKANSSRCISNLRQMAKSVSLYTAENNGFLPLCYGRPDSSVTADRIWYQFLQYADAYLLKGDGVLKNPNTANHPQPTVYNCPSNPGRITTWDTPSYAYNGSIGSSTKKTLAANIPWPSKTVLLVDAGDRVTNSQPQSKGPPLTVCYRTDFAGSTFPWDRSVNFNVHNGIANFVFVDGHAEQLTREMVRQRGEDLSLLWSNGNLYSSGPW